MSPVLHVTRDLPPRTRGGISTAVGALVADDPACRVVSFDGWRPSGAGGTAAVDGRVCRLDGPAGLPAARAFATAAPPSRIVVHHAQLWAFGAEVGAEVGAPVDLFVHVVQSALRALRGLAEPTGSEVRQAEALAVADRILVPGEAARRLLAGAHPLAAARAVLAPLRPSSGWVDTPSTAQREPQRVLCVGRYDVAKGTADVLAALPRLLAACPDAVLVLAGGLPDNPRSERRWLSRWRATVPPAVADRLVATGWLSHAEVIGELDRAAVVLAPSHMETFGLGVLEAQLRGCAVVATDLPAHRERIAPGVTGLLVPPGDPDALAAGAASLLADPIRARALGEAARAATAPGARPRA